VFKIDISSYEFFSKKTIEGVEQGHPSFQIQPSIEQQPMPLHNSAHKNAAQYFKSITK
jgi:hypothetical protein